MMQSKTFMNMWDGLGFEKGNHQEQSESFIFPLNNISKACFEKIIEWLDEHKGQPEPEIKEDPITKEVIIKN